MLNDIFDKEELLIRAVFPADTHPFLWKEDGSLSSAAFKDKNGLSVSRTGDRTLSEALDFTSKRLSGVMATVSVQSCLDMKLFLKYLPIPEDNYHSEIHRNDTKAELTQGQARQLAKIAKLHKID